jgi:hypothetical protein
MGTGKTSIDLGIALTFGPAGNLQPHPMSGVQTY